MTDPNTVKELNAAPEPDHNFAIRSQCYGTHETSRAKKLQEANPGDKFGGKSGGNSPRKNTQKRMLIKQAAKWLIARNERRKDGGRSRNRTYDLAHVRRAL